MYDKVYYCGESHTYEDGDKRVHGAQGEVTGPSPVDTDKKVAVRFPGNKDNIGCLLTQLSRTPPGGAATPAGPTSTREAGCA